jgi:hypothetical protein
MSSIELIITNIKIDVKVVSNVVYQGLANVQQKNPLVLLGPILNVVFIIPPSPRESIRNHHLCI